MSKTSIKEKVKIKLWTLAGGRCQYDGCNVPLWKDELTMAHMNRAYIAHIIADSEDGPRGHPERSELLKESIENLMLMCDAHHRMIDLDVSTYTEAKLIEMKRKHESRIEFLTSMLPNKQSHIVMYGSTIGVHNSPLNYQTVKNAMFPHNYPHEYCVELSLKNSAYKDFEIAYFREQAINLERLFQEHVARLKANSEIQHYSVFALAPQPLLIKLGTLFSDLYPMVVYQKHREPDTWAWLDEDITQTNYELVTPAQTGRNVCLKLELSATIQNDRIINVLGDDCAIWSIRIENPYNDYLKNKQQLIDFRNILRHTFDKIKAIHGQNTQLNIFPAMPVAAAVEMGRVWMPKADMAMSIYDQNKAKKGFFLTLIIK
jgi:SMODS-associated and fused to various effectors sensor domain